MKPRKTPYTPAGLTRLRCAHCGARAEAQWHLDPCALVGGGGWLPLCLPCDLELNAYTLDFFRVEGRERMIRRYAGRG